MSNPRFHFPWGIVLTVAFFPAVFFGVFGLAQMRELRAEQTRRGRAFFAMRFEAGDFRRYALPAWFRGAVWFASTISTVSVLQALLA
jgi:hypothetical protein